METCGTILHVDLSSGRTWREGITEKMRRLYVGGRGISARQRLSELQLDGIEV